MKIYLINSVSQSKAGSIQAERSFFPPLGLAYLAAYLQQYKHSVKIIDRRVVYLNCGLDLNRMNEIVIEDIEKFSPDLIGFSATTGQMYDVQDFSQVLKDKFPGAMIIAGGSHPTFSPEDTLTSCPAVDYAIVGEGEIPLCAIADLGCRDLEKIKGIKGVAYRSNGKPIVNGAADIIENLDSIPMPARDLLDMDFYLTPFIARVFLNRMTSLITSRGCPFSCNFCTGSLTKKLRFHSPAYVVNEVLAVVNKYDVEVLYFADDFFLAEYDRAVEICRGFIKSGIARRAKWIAQLRPSLIKKDEKTHLEVLKLMKQAGCAHIEYGFESGSQEELARMNKKADANDFLKLVRLSKQAGLCVYANIIVGYVDETEADLKMTYEFLKSSNVEKIQVSRFYPLPGTSAYKTLLQRGYALDWDQSTIPGSCKHNYTQMSDEVLTGQVNKITRLASVRNFVCLFLNNLTSHPFRLIEFIVKKVFEVVEYNFKR